MPKESHLIQMASCPSVAAPDDSPGAEDASMRPKRAMDEEEDIAKKSRVQEEDEALAKKLQAEEDAKLATQQATESNNAKEVQSSSSSSGKPVEEETEVLEASPAQAMAAAAKMQAIINKGKAGIKATSYSAPEGVVSGGGSKRG